MLFLQYIMINLVLTKSLGPEAMRFCLPRKCSPVSVCVTQILVGRGSSYSNFPPPRPHPVPTLISLWTAHLSWLWADLPTNLWAIQPTCCEVTDFKKAVSQRVKKVAPVFVNGLTLCICL